MGQADYSIDAPLVVLMREVDLGQVPIDRVVAKGVLENMPDPWAALKIGKAGLRPGGLLLVSVPTVRSLAVLRQLVVSSSFALQDQGLMDRTHLRWFTRRSIEMAVQAVGFVDIKSAQVSRVKDNAAKAFSLDSDGLKVRKYGLNATEASA